MYRFATALVAGLFLALPTFAQADPAAVVKAAIDAHGGAAALNKSKTARSKSKGTLAIAGRGDIEFVSAAVYSVPDKFKLDMAADIQGLKLTSQQVIAGKQVKIKTVLAGAEQPARDKVKEETMQAVLLQEVTTLTPLVEGKKYTLAADKDADVNGVPCKVVAVSGNGIKDVKLFFDAKTGLLTKTQRKALAASATTEFVEVTEESYLADFQKVDGALLPMKVKVTHDGKKFMDVTVTEVKFLDKIDPAEFEAK